MNRRMSDICDRYGLDYWVWTPADFDLNDQAVRDAMLDKHEALYRECKELTGVFFPGGDPGHNLPELVLPFLEDIAKRLIAIHPDARVWLSLQWFNRQQIETIFAYLDEKSPTWLGGLVAGPSSPPVPLTRLRLDKKYKFRLYPDITHNKLCQYPVPWWDQAYVLTLGREAINPRPVQYTHIFQRVAPYSDGFITYSDGVHDDVNKTIWSALGWDPSQNPRDILVEYARFFFMPTVAEDAADGMLALERSWQMNVLRAYYDAYTRKRLLRESHLEELANAALATAGKIGADTAMQRAMGILKQEPVDESLLEGRRRIEQLCEAVFDSIGLQTSVEKYHASGAERGACLDFVDYPLNNRWWLEDEFARIAAMPTESDKLARLEVIRTWETPGPGSFYDDLGNVLKSTHVIRGGNRSGPDELQADRTPTFWWWDDGMSRARLSWQCTLDWPLGVMYEGLDPQASYTVRSTGYGQALLRIDGQRVEPTLDGKEMGEFKEFPVPAEHLQDAKGSQLAPALAIGGSLADQKVSAARTLLHTIGGTQHVIVGHRSDLMIDISPVDETTFDVTVKAGATTTHRVTVARDDHQALTGGNATVETLLEASFAFLLERESNTSILRTFDLPVIGRYFPEYESQMKRRFA
jgi:hypothetical protein